MRKKKTNDNIERPPDNSSTIDSKHRDYEIVTHPRLQSPRVLLILGDNSDGFRRDRLISCDNRTVGSKILFLVRRSRRAVPISSNYCR